MDLSTIYGITQVWRLWEATMCFAACGQTNHCVWVGGSVGTPAGGVDSVLLPVLAANHCAWVGGSVGTSASKIYGVLLPTRPAVKTVSWLHGWNSMGESEGAGYNAWQLDYCTHLVQWNPVFTTVGDAMPEQDDGNFTNFWCFKWSTHVYICCVDGFSVTMEKHFCVTACLEHGNVNWWSAWLPPSFLVAHKPHYDCNVIMEAVKQVERFTS